jgi:hypothetical protein
LASAADTNNGIMQSRKISRKIEKWSDIISQLDIDVSKPINYLTAKQIKQITNEDARLMAKIDRIESLPRVFRDNNLFLLPISRKEYAIVRGTGYHQLEAITDIKPINYTIRLPLPSSWKTESEGVLLENANSCGLLREVTGIPDLAKTVIGRTTTPKFTFDVDRSQVTVNHAQIEVDAGFENSKEIILFEAKIGVPTSFAIRQLYYPFRTVYQREKKTVRNFFFCLRQEGEKRLYLFWEYKFDPYDSFESIKLVQCKQYQIKVSHRVPVKAYQNVKPVKSKKEIPQADDVNKIIEFPLRVFEGYDTAEKIKHAFGFVNRQSSYYRQASEILGLVSKDREWKYKLTDRGEEFLRLPSRQKSQYVCKLLLEFPIINEVFLDVSIDPTKVIGKQSIIGLLKKYSHLSGSTLERRAQTIISWFKWIRNNVGIVEVNKNGDIRISRQTN